MTERELISLLKQKDRETFKYVVETWQNMVYNTSLGILQNDRDAEDCAQEVFVQVFESIEKFKEESKLSTWIYRITVSKALDYLRKKKSKKRFAFIKSLWDPGDQAAPDPPDFTHPGVMLENKENAAALFKALERLPESQKSAFVLNKMEQLSYAEVAEILNLSTAAVDSLLQRARQNLKKHLKNYYKEISNQ